MPKPNNAPQVNIQRPCYAMASTDGQTADITMYGEIVETQPIDWWTDEPIPGQYIIESEFLSDLQQVENCPQIIIRMDSLGGDAGVSILIHNRLRELAAKGTKLTCIVDGVAMSGGSLIMCACDTVKVNPSSLVMIHKCWTPIRGALNADELRKAAEANDAWDKSQVAIYKRKTGLSETVLLHMMGDTTYMTGKEAIEKGFANELLDDAEPVAISASADRQTIYAKGHALRLMPGVKLPDNIPINKLTDGEGVNVIFEAAGVPALLAHATSQLSPAGRLVAMTFGKEPIPVNFKEINAKELTILGTRHQYQKFPEVVKILPDHLKEVDEITTHVFKAEDFQKAFDTLADRNSGAGKVVLTFA